MDNEEENYDDDDVSTDDEVLSSVHETPSNADREHDSSTLINAFQLIGMSSCPDLSSIFKNEDVSEKKIIFTSHHSPRELLEMIENMVKQIGFHVPTVKRILKRSYTYFMSKNFGLSPVISCKLMMCFKFWKLVVCLSSSLKLLFFGKLEIIDCSMISPFPLLNYTENAGRLYLEMSCDICSKKLDLKATGFSSFKFLNQKVFWSSRDMSICRGHFITFQNCAWLLGMVG